MEKTGKISIKIYLSAGLLVFVCLRLLVLFGSLDILYEDEELYRGTLAYEVIRGSAISLWDYLDYQVEYFPGGTLVVGLLAVPFFLIFGPSYFALKCVGLLFSCGTFLVWGIFISKFFGRKAFFWYLLLAIFCIPLATFTSLITWGAHPEANFFTSLGILIFYLIFWQKIHTNGIFLLFGIICGFALWFAQTYFLALLFILAGWFAFDKRFYLKKEFFIFCFGVLLGSWPSFYYLLRYGQNSWSINGSNLFFDVLFCQLEYATHKFFMLIFYDLPHAFLFSDVRISYVYYILFMAAFFSLAWNCRHALWRITKSISYPLTLIDHKVAPLEITKESLLFFYPALFLLGYSFSGVRRPYSDDYIGYRYFIPLLPFIPVLLAIFIAKFTRKKSVLFLGTALVLLGLFGNLNLINIDNFGKYFQDKGYSYAALGDKIGLRKESGLKDYLGRFSRLNEVALQQLYIGLGAGIAWRMRERQPEEIIVFFDKETDPAFLPSLYCGWGTLYFLGDEEERRQVFDISKSIPDQFRDYFYEGVGRNIDFEKFNSFLNLAESIPTQYRHSYFRGLGYGIAFNFRDEERLRMEYADKVAQDYRVYVYEGIQLFMRNR